MLRVCLSLISISWNESSGGLREIQPISCHITFWNWWTENKQHYHPITLNQWSLILIVKSGILFTFCHLLLARSRKYQHTWMYTGMELPQKGKYWNSLIDGYMPCNVVTNPAYLLFIQTLIRVTWKQCKLEKLILLLKQTNELDHWSNNHNKIHILFHGDVSTEINLWGSFAIRLKSWQFHFIASDDNQN